MNDLRFAFRQLLKNAGFTTMAMLSLAVGLALTASTKGNSASPHPPRLRQSRSIPPSCWRSVGVEAPLFACS